MDIGTAKVPVADRARVPHHGLDLVDPDQPFSAADFQRAALQALEGIAARGGVAILVGGTGLYLRAVARGFPLDETGRDAQLRARLEARLDDEGGLGLLAEELGRLAPNVAANTDLANPRRVVRALERAMIHGDRPPPEPRGYPAPLVWLGLHVDPATHAQWIADRARAQFATGLVDEAAELKKRFGPGMRAFSAFGYREAFGALEGSMTRDQAIETTITRTNQFARRQRTWFRAEPDIHWLDSSSETLSAARAWMGSILR